MDERHVTSVDPKLEHLLRELPAFDAERVFLESQATTWRTALGVHAHLLRAVPLGTPLGVVAAGGEVFRTWRHLVPPRPGSAWEELTLLGALFPLSVPSPSADVFDTLGQLRTSAQAAALTYRH